jgi:hypothetical protein
MLWVQTKLSRHIGGRRGRQPRERPPVGVPANRNSYYVATIWFAPNAFVFRSWSDFCYVYSRYEAIFYVVF